jgi:hypothetical protein
MLIAYARFAQSCPVDWHSSFKRITNFFEVSIMHLKKVIAVTLFATILLVASSATAQFIPPANPLSNGWGQVANSLSGGQITNDLNINFDGQLSGVQLLIELTSGSIHQDAAGAAVPPNAAVVGALPNLAWDTFVALDSAVSGGPHGEPSLGGGAVNLGGAAAPSFTSALINQGYFPGPGVTSATDGRDFLAARVTLSPDAAGTATYLASANGVISDAVVTPIVNGVIGSIIPEPSTFVLLGLGLVGLVALKRRNG